MKEPEYKNAGQVGHGRVASNVAQTLIRAPNTKDKALKIKREIEFGVEGIPASQKSAWSVVFEGQKKTDKNQN